VKFHLVGPYYPLRGGIAQYLALLGRRLEEEGHQVKVLAFRKQFPGFLFPGRTQTESSSQYIRLAAEAVFIPWNPWSWFKTFYAARRDAPDALIFKYWMPFFAPGYAAVCRLVRAFTRIKVLFILDNVIPHERRPGDRFLTRLAFRWVDGFIVQSEAVRKDLETWFPESKNRKVVFVPHPVYDCYGETGMSREEARVRLGVPKQGKLILFFGLVRHYKGLDILLKAMPAIRDGWNEPIHLLIAGEFYEPEEIYRDLIRSLDLQESVTIVNRYIPNEEVGICFQAADLLVLPYRSATQSGILQIAQNFGTPVISTTVGGLPEAADALKGASAVLSSDRLIPPESPEKLADAVIRFFARNPEPPAREGKDADFARETWSRLIQALVSLTRD
jgi:glycosyltransferase involved in cell wall biosynthesis